MVEVVGEPELGRAPVAGGETGAQRGEAALALGIAGAVEAAKARGEDRLVTEVLEQGEEGARHPPVARGDGVVGGFERGVEGDPHQAASRAAVSPKRAARRTTPGSAAKLSTIRRRPARCGSPSTP